MKRLLLSIVCFSLLTAFTACEDDDQMVDLPDIVQGYVSSNYPDHEIEESEEDTLCTGTAILEVEIEGANDEELELTFSTEGAFLFSETEIETTTLPTAITNSINTNYGNYSIEEAERLDMADGSNQYEVALKEGTSQLEVLFDTEGNVICEEIDDDE